MADPNDNIISQGLPPTPLPTGASTTPVPDPSTAPLAPDTPSSTPPAPSAPAQTGTVDPTRGGLTDAQYKQAVADTGLPVSEDTEAFLGDVADMEAVNGKTGLLKGWKLPPDVSTHDFWAIVSDAQSFAAITGWKYFPTPQQLVAGLRSGLVAQGSDAIYAWLAKTAGVTDTMPWAAHGQDRDKWQKTIGNYNDAYEDATGQRLSDNDPLLMQAVNGNWSTDRFTNYLSKDPALQKKYGYLAYGMDYHTWQNFKLQKKQEAISRFGANPGDAAYMSLLQDPVHEFHDKGSPITKATPGSGAKDPRLASLSAVR